MVGDDVVADAGMNGERNCRGRKLCARTQVCFHGCSTSCRPAGQAVNTHGLQQFGPGRASGCEGSARSAASSDSTEGRVDAVPGNEFSNGCFQIRGLQPAAQQGEMNVAARFIPRPKGAGGDILPDVLGGEAEKGKFPVVDDARAVGGQVGDPAAFPTAGSSRLAAPFLIRCAP